MFPINNTFPDALAAPKRATSLSKSPLSGHSELVSAAARLLPSLLRCAPRAGGAGREPLIAEGGETSPAPAPPETRSPVPSGGAELQVDTKPEGAGPARGERGRREGERGRGYRVEREGRERMERERGWKKRGKSVERKEREGEREGGREGGREAGREGEREREREREREKEKTDERKKTPHID